MPIRSMTGFARVSRSTPSGELVLSIKTVNHRGLDMHFHMPLDFDAVENGLRAAVRKRVARGHVQVQLNLRRTDGVPMGAIINEPLLRAWLDTFRDLAGRFGIESQPDLNQALRLPGMMESRPEHAATASPAGESVENDALSAAAEALDQLDSFRAREGAAIEGEIRARSASIREIVQRMEEIRGRALPFFQQRLRDRLGEMLGGALIDPARIVQEAAILAERSDISEELVRLKTHADQADALLAAEGETGKKLDFLLQEMNRETNTILSKTGGLGEPGLCLTDLGLAAKAEIDRMREQALNIE
jgi:uncharacterized protein (TIGR00255 family)